MVEILCLADRCQLLCVAKHFAAIMARAAAKLCSLGCGGPHADRTKSGTMISMDRSFILTPWHCKLASANGRKVKKQLRC